MKSREKHTIQPGGRISYDLGGIGNENTYDDPEYKNRKGNYTSFVDVEDLPVESEFSSEEVSKKDEDYFEKRGEYLSRKYGDSDKQGKKSNHNSSLQSLETRRKAGALEALKKMSSEQIQEALEKMNPN